MQIIQNHSSRDYSQSSTFGSTYNSTTYQFWVDLIHRHVLFQIHKVRQFSWELEVLYMIENNTVKMVVIIDGKYDREEPHGRHCLHAVIGYKTGLILFSTKASSSQRQNGFNRNPFEADEETNAIYHSRCKHMESDGTYGGTANSMDWITGEAAVKKLFEVGLTPQMIMDGKKLFIVVASCFFNHVFSIKIFTFFVFFVFLIYSRW